MVQDVAAMVVSTFVGNVRADFVQTRCPDQFLRVAFTAFIADGDLFKQRGTDLLHTLCLYRVHAEALGQPAHGAFTHVTGVGLSVDQVVQGTLAQRTLCRQHLFNAKELENGSQHAQATADDGQSILFDAF